MRIAIILTAVMFAASAGYLTYPKEPGYANRSIVEDGHGLRGVGRPPLSLASLFHHSEISEQVLLIRSLNVVNDVSRFGAAKVLKRAMAQGDVSASAADSALAAWLESMEEPAKGLLVEKWPNCTSPSPSCLSAVPLRLGAVVFRPDLARFHCSATGKEDGRVCGAEIRFDFGVPREDPGREASLIVEFVLATRPKSEFQDLIRSWFGMASVSVDRMPDELANRLERDVFRDGALNGARIRINASHGVRQEWRLYEFHLDGGIHPDVLDGEIDVVRWRKFGSRCELSDPALAFLNGFALPTDRIQIPGGIATSTAFVPAPSRVELGDHVTGSDNKQIRFRLALNTCTGCHSNEVAFGAESSERLRFSHISRRGTNDKSLLSPFLTGGARYGDPTLDYYEVNLNFNGDGECHSETERHRFNDLLRRELYLKRVLDLDSTLGDWTSRLSDLTAYESH